MRITIPEEEVPWLLVALPHRVRWRRGQLRRHLLSPHSQVLFPLSRTGRGLHDPGLTSHLRAGLPGELRHRRGGPQVPQVNGASEDHQCAPRSHRELSRRPGHMRTHVQCKHTARAGPSAPILNPASGYPSSGFVALYLAPRLMPGPVLLHQSHSALWKLFLNALSPLCKALPPFLAETVQRLSSLKPGMLLLRDNQNLFENQRAPWEPGDWN